MEWYNTTLWLNLRPVFWNLVRVPPEKRDRALVNDSIAKLTASMEIADARLAENRYISGNAFTMGDIPMGVAAFRWFNLPFERRPLPNLDAWYRRIRGRPAFKQHCMAPLT